MQLNTAQKISAQSGMHKCWPLESFSGRYLYLAILKVLTRIRALHRIKSGYSQSSQSGIYAQTEQRNLPLRTLRPQRYTSAPHVTNLRLRTRITRTIWTLHTAPALIHIEFRNQAMVLLHRLRDPMPICCIQWRIFRPANGIRFASRVLKFEDWSGLAGIERGETAHVGIVRVCIVN
jgi:hypothetical protein